MYRDRKSAEQLADQVIRIEGYYRRLYRFIVNIIKKFICVLTVLTFISMPRYAMAQECKEPLPVSSPCTGVLLPPSAAESGLKCLRVEVPRLNLELDFAKKERASVEKYYTSLVLAEQNRNAALEKQIDILLKKDIAPKWYESPAFHFAIGFVTASAVTIGITYAVNSD